MGVIDALNEGFRIVVRKPLLLTIPILLDLGLLISPKPSVSELLVGVDAVNPADIEVFGSFLSAVLLLLVALHVPSLGAAESPAIGELGGAVELGGGGSLFGMALLMLLVGGIISTAYLGLIRRTIFQDAEEYQFSALMMDRVPHLLGLAVIAVLSLVALLLLFALAWAFLGVLAIFVGMVVATGLMAIPFLMFFANVSVIVDDSSPRGAIRRSIEFISSDAWPVTGIIMLTVIVQMMAGLVLTQISGSVGGYVIAVVGNAFVGTVLAAGSMVFYLSRTYDIELSHEEVSEN